MKVTAQEIFQLIEDRVIEAYTASRTDLILIDRVDPPDEATSTSVSWLRGNVDLSHWRGGVLLLDAGHQRPTTPETPYAIYRCADPKGCMARIIRTYFSSLARSVRITPSSRANIHPTAVIGADGQGYDWDDELGWVGFPQIGGVLIHDGVTIGPCSTIMRAAIGRTVIGQGSKIGNGVNIGHGVQIGEHCLISAHTTIGGSARIGNRVVLWQNVTVRNGVRIGDGAVVGMGSVVLDDISPGETWVGNPATCLRPKSAP